MKLLYIIQIVIFIFSLVNSEKRVRIYKRIPEYEVATSIYNFVNDNSINNCFSFKETDTLLLLKCWRYNKLVNVQIDINDDEKNDKIYYTGISIVV